MNVLFISSEGSGLGVAQRLAMEGDAVNVFIEGQRYAKAGRGIINRVKSWQSAAKQADLIIADCVGYGKLEEELKAQGKPSIGFSHMLDKIELNRIAGMALFEKAGIETPLTLAFDNPGEAERLVKQRSWGKGWVIKPNGNLNVAKTMLVKEQDQLATALGKLPRASSGILQQIVTGVEVSTEGWFNGRDFVEFNHTFEEKRFLAGNLGPNTGCMGNVVFDCGEDKLVRATVANLAGFLQFLDYRGPVDINSIVDEHSAYALEVTSRMGYDAIEALLEGLDQPAGLFLSDIARGARGKPAVVSEAMIAVRLSIPPFPARLPDGDTPPQKVRGINEETLRHLFLTDLYKEGEDYLTANGDGVLLKATAIGTTDKDRMSQDGSKRYKNDYTYNARRRVYRLLERIDVQDKQYRIDIGARVNDDLAKLQEWGWVEK